MSKTTDNQLKTIVILSLLTGTLDAIAAIIISRPATPFQIAKYIASGAFGESAFVSENMILWGILFHYLIAAAFSAALFSLHPKFKIITKNEYLLAIIYGLFIWVVMNLAVLPLTNIPKQPPHARVDWMAILKGMVALIICLGFPISFISNRYYLKKARRRSRRHRAGSSL